MKTRNLCLIAMILVVMSASVLLVLDNDQDDFCGADDSFVDADIYYHVTGPDTVEVTGTDLSGPMIIPPTIERFGNIYAVKSIHESAVEGKGITSLHVPDSVTSFGDACFADCKNLQTVKLDACAKETGVGMFKGCSSLTEVEMGGSISRISDFTFHSCTSLSEITLPESLRQIGSFAFAGCPLEQIKLPDNLTSIGSGAFKGCTELRDISIPMRVRNINPVVFNGCSSLEYVTLPEGIRLIGLEAFKNTGLKAVEIPDNVKTIRRDAFYLCKSLQQANVPMGIEIIEQNVFSNCSSDIKFIIPDELSEKVTPDKLIKGEIIKIKEGS